MDLGTLSTVIGGIGLFLLGMFLMTNGLKLAAGKSLQNILERSTRTLLRGILTGIAITSAVQSSSAITVATLGFVNAGLLRLHQAIAVIYGSNIGTTMTAWLVALIGFNINIKAFALPAIGIGMLMRLLWNDKRNGAIGEALAGFGVFFLGIEILKGGFEGLGTNIQFSELSPEGLGLLFLVGSGFVMTVLMQSSSAAMAIIITATGGGVVPLPAAAAMVIGANVGTTTTALIAVIGATPNAKRAAAAHVCFNLITATVALIILPWLLAAVHVVQSELEMASNAPTILALFHTSFNVLGVALLWPITARMVEFLQLRFRSSEEDEAKPRYIDHTLLQTPVLAFRALGMELTRIADIGRRMAKGAISAELGPGLHLSNDKSALTQLVNIAGEYSVDIQKANLPSDLAEALPNGIRVSRYYTTVAHLAETISEHQSHLRDLSLAALNDEIVQFKKEIVQLIDVADSDRENYDGEQATNALNNIQERYQHLKATLLRAGTEGKVNARDMVGQLELLSLVRRLAEQIEKGARYLNNFNTYIPAETLEEETNHQ